MCERDIKRWIKREREIKRNRERYRDRYQQELHVLVKPNVL